MSDLILASASPRRRDLLRAAGIPFSVVIPNIDEWDHATHPELSPPELVLANARRKAEEIANRHPAATVLAADTAVVCEGRFLGKPADREEAVAMLKFLAGKTHEVLTGVALCAGGGETKTEVARTLVTFRELNDDAIADYMSKVNVMDKAGAYGYQEHGDLIVERTAGSVTNIIGLPMEIVLRWLGNG